MAGIYDRELDIPQKPRTLGWLLLIAGVVMMVLAVGSYVYYNKQMAKIHERPWEPETKSDSANATEMPEDGNVQKYRGLLGWTLFAVGGLFAFVLVATVSHRFAVRLRSALDKKAPKTKEYDPWREAGRRMKVPDE